MSESISIYEAGTKTLRIVSIEPEFKPDMLRERFRTYILAGVSGEKQADGTWRIEYVFEPHEPPATFDDRAITVQRAD